MSTFVYTRNFNERLGLKVSLINVDIYKKFFIQETFVYLMKG